MLQITVDISVPPVNCTFLRSGAMTYVPGSEWVGNKCLYWLIAVMVIRSMEIMQRFCCSHDSSRIWKGVKDPVTWITLLVEQGFKYATKETLVKSLPRTGATCSSRLL